MKIQRYHYLFLMLFLALGLILSSCSKDGEAQPEETETPSQIPGLGNAGGIPEGEPFSLPSGVHIAEEIRGYICDTTLTRGSGYYVTVCAGFVNDNNEDIILSLPAGLLLIAQDTSYQNGLLLQGTSIILKKNTVTRCTLNTFCANSSRSSSSRSCLYSMGLVTKSSLIGELITLLQGKLINAEDYGSDVDGYMSAAGIIQSALWSITDGEGLQEYERSSIAALPNK